MQTTREPGPHFENISLRGLENFRLTSLTLLLWSQMKPSPVKLASFLTNSRASPAMGSSPFSVLCHSTIPGVGASVSWYHLPLLLMWFPISTCVGLSTSGANKLGPLTLMLWGFKTTRGHKWALKTMRPQTELLTSFPMAQPCKGAPSPTRKLGNTYSQSINKYLQSISKCQVLGWGLRLKW